MSNEEILRAQFAASENRSEWPRAMAAYDEDVVLLAGEGLSNPGPHFGKAAVGKWFADWLAAFDDIAFDDLTMERGRDGLAAHARHAARGRESGILATVDLYYAYWFREGKIVRVEIHRDRVTAWRAAGVTG